MPTHGLMQAAIVSIILPVVGIQALTEQLVCEVYHEAEWMTDSVPDILMDPTNGYSYMVQRQISVVPCTAHGTAVRDGKCGG